MVPGLLSESRPPVASRGAVPRGLRSRPARAPPLGAALRMLGSAGGRAGGSDLETPEGWKRRRRRRRWDARSSVGVCGARSEPGTRASLAFAVQGAGLRVCGGIRAPGVARVWQGRPCARTEHWVAGWRGAVVCRDPRQRLLGPGTPVGVSSSRASPSRWSLGLAWPGRALHRVCRRQSAGVSSGLLSVRGSVCLSTGLCL